MSFPHVCKESLLWFWLRGRVYTHCGAIFCCMGLPRASPVNPPKQAQAATDGATMRVYLAPQVDLVSDRFPLGLMDAIY